MLLSVPSGLFGLEKRDDSPGLAKGFLSVGGGVNGGFAKLEGGVNCSVRRVYGIDIAGRCAASRSCTVLLRGRIAAETS